jgi:hypothetical protein
MLPIPTKVTSWAKREGSDIKEVTCEACGQQYVYLLRRTVYVPWDFSIWHNNKLAWKSAGMEADLKLRDALRNGYGDVPCPHCGWIQNHMFKMARNKRAAIPFYAGLLVLLVPVLFGVYVAVTVINPAVERGQAVDFRPYAMIAAPLLAVSLVFTTWAWRCATWWNPNSASVEARLRRARKLALTREAYLELLKANEG